MSSPPNPRPLLRRLAAAAALLAIAQVPLAANGEPIDAMVVVTPDGAKGAVGRTYTGELVVGVTRNGVLSDATVTVFRSGGREVADSGRSYDKATHNPRRSAIAAGEYDVEIASVEIADRPSHRWEKVTVRPGEATELAHDFPSGTLRVGATTGGALADAAVTVRSAADGSSVTAGRTYTGASTNPRSFVLSPGTYRVTVKPVRVPTAPPQELTVEVAAGETVERTVEVPAPG